MADRGIIFSAPMVRALLEGRKTQTRRLASSPLRCCKPGDRLWVRENWQALSPGDYAPTKDSCYADVRYAATDPLAAADKDVRGYSWRPSIHMPRWASRLTLLVEDVRFEPLLSIGREDALAEGIAAREHGYVAPGSRADLEGRCFATPSTAYASLWMELHGGESWSGNPEVVALTFGAVQRNIDQVPA